MTRDKDDPASAESWTVVDGQAPLTSAASAPLFSPGDVLLERYELRHILGRGGMGVVFETYDRVLDQTIALKIVRAEYAGERAWAERLAREVKLARQINHPNVCRVFDIGMAERHPFLTMEFASRGTLRDEIASGDFTARPLEERLSDVRAIASGLAAIHAAGIIHRDVAPQNVLRLADGSVVLSDFGLATDRFEGTSSLQGGTLSYMAPEVVRGARASTASDIWSLGVVIHEFVFGARPRWSTGGKNVLPPGLGRTLLPAEKVALQVCRACLAESPAARPNGAAEVAQWLCRGVPIWRRRSIARAVGVVAAMVCAAVVAGEFSGRSFRSPSTSEAAAKAPMLIPTGTPEEWSERARVLAEVPDRIACMVALPDGESLRFVWGRPRIAEDVNVRTGNRIHSPLVPEAFAEGCPDTTRDGRVVFTGYTPDERPFAFVSKSPDGGKAVPVVPIAEPSFLSDPVWFPDGDRFQYDIDGTHAAIYSVSAKQATVLSANSEAHWTLFRGVAAGRSVLLLASFALTTDVQVFSSPFVGPDLSFQLPFFVSHVASPDGRLFFMPISNRIADGPMAIVDAVAKRARIAGFIDGQAIREPVLIGNSLAFWTMRRETFLAVKGRPDVAVPPDLALAARCGRDLLAMRALEKRRVLVRLDESGRQLRELKVDGEPSDPHCTPDGRTFFYLANQSEVRRCEVDRCSTIARDVFGFNVSPDGGRIALFTRKNPPLGLAVMDSNGASRTPLPVVNINPCEPSWETNDLLWVSVRRGHSTVWQQIAVSSGTSTGRTIQGRSDCSDGLPDPANPFPPDVQVTVRWHGQVRVLAEKPRIDNG